MRTQDVIDHFGGIPALARALGISRHAIYQWGEEVPDGRAYQIEVLTNGALRAKTEDGCEHADNKTEKYDLPKLQKGAA